MIALIIQNKFSNPDNQLFTTAESRRCGPAENSEALA